jgi:hypothetical protein
MRSYITSAAFCIDIEKKMQRRNRSNSSVLKKPLNKVEEAKI